MLKPCPFCGSNSLKLRKQKKIYPSEAIDEDTYEHIEYYVSCTKCMARGPLNILSQDAERRWNGRSKMNMSNVLSKEELQIFKKASDIIYKFTMRKV